MEAKPVKQMYGAVLDTEESFVKVSSSRKCVFRSKCYIKELWPLLDIAKDLLFCS